MNTADTSLLVAAFARWHGRHDAARVALGEASLLLAHVAIETFSVLTRLPPPRRAPPELVLRFLDHHFPHPLYALDGTAYRRLLEQAVANRLTGGAVYDALVGTAAAAAGATLLSLDARATTTYDAVGASYRLI